MTPLVRFSDCPIGLFIWNDQLCAKTGYSTIAGEGAFVVATGKWWAGKPTMRPSSERREDALVRPISATALVEVIGAGLAVADVTIAGGLQPGGPTYTDLRIRLSLAIESLLLGLIGHGGQPS